MIQEKGMDKLKSGGVMTESLELGEKFARQIQAGELPVVSVRFVNDQVGYGLFAEEEIVEGFFVGEYTGLVRENNRRYFEPLNHYCYEYPVTDAMGRSFVIDATQGNLTRFINHSFKPNLKPRYAFLDGFYHCIFIAQRTIAKGTQLTYDYGQSYWYVRSPPQPLQT